MNKGWLIFIALIAFTIYQRAENNKEQEVRAKYRTAPSYAAPANSGSGREAGYEWALNKGIRDASDCSGNSRSFIRGCEEYIESQYEEATDQDAYEY